MVKKPSVDSTIHRNQTNDPEMTLDADLTVAVPQVRTPVKATVERIETPAFNIRPRRRDWLGRAR